MTQQLDWLAYAVTGKEFIAMDDMERLGIDHWRGKRIEFERRGKARTADPYDYPALHNYIWIRPEPSQVAKLRDVRFLGKTFHIMGAHAVREFSAFKARVQAKLDDANAIIAQHEAIKKAAEQRDKDAERKTESRNMIRAAIAEYKAGEPIEIRDGVLAGEMAMFRRLVQGAGDVFPFIEAEMQVMGRSTLVRVDPLSVRRASHG